MKKTGTIITGRVVIGAYGTMPSLINDGVVERIIEPPEGGTFLKFIGCSYLYKGNPNKEVVDILAFPKRRLRNFVSFLTTKIGKILLVLLFPFRRQIAIFLAEQYLKDIYFGPLYRNLYMGKSRYCVSIQELWRVATLFIGEIKTEKIQNIFFKLRNIVCMILEYDNAYRFPLQDIFPEFNKEKLKENPVKEIKRVFEIFCERWDDERLRKIKRLVPFLRIFRKERDLIVRFLLELDYDKVKMDEADWYFCLGKTYYNFKGKLIEERLKERRMIDRQKHHFIPSVKVIKWGV